MVNAAEQQMGFGLRRAITELNAGDCESTSYPFWMVVDPKQNLRCDYHYLAQMVTGPFFSRASAEEYLKSHRYNYSERAVVYCMSGCYSKEWQAFVHAAVEDMDWKTKVIQRQDEQIALLKAEIEALKAAKSATPGVQIQAGKPEEVEPDALYAVFEHPHCRGGVSLGNVMRGEDCNWRSRYIAGYLKLPLRATKAEAKSYLRGNRQFFGDCIANRLVAG